MLSSDSASSGVFVSSGVSVSFGSSSPSALVAVPSFGFLPLEPATLPGVVSNFPVVFLSASSFGASVSLSFT